MYRTEGRRCPEEPFLTLASVEKTDKEEEVEIQIDKRGGWRLSLFLV